MKVMLLKDVYKLGRAGDVKKVADGYGRNYLLPQGLAVLATPGMLKRVEHIRTQAAARRVVLNNELSGIAEQIAGQVFTFGTKAGETGKLYGSVTTQMITDALNTRLGTKIDRHQVECDPIRNLGEYKAHVRLTVDLVPEITVIVHREGEKLAVAKPAAAVEPTPQPAAKEEEAAQPEMAVEEAVVEDESPADEASEEPSEETPA